MTLRQQDIDNIKAGALGTIRGHNGPFVHPADTLLLIKEIERLKKLVEELMGSRSLSYAKYFELVEAVCKLPQSYQDDITDSLAEDRKWTGK